VVVVVVMLVAARLLLLLLLSYCVFEVMGVVRVSKYEVRLLVAHFGCINM
jgi:hypothetical protein